MKREAPKGGRGGLIPSWGMNLLGFGLLIAFVLSVFFWQMTQIHGNLQKNALDRSQMVAAIIEEILSTADQARNTIDEVIIGFLEEKARFALYLDSVAPLQTAELEALAQQTGLLGISLQRTDGTTVHGPASWSTKTGICGDDGLSYQPIDGTGLLTFRPRDGSGGEACILLGFDAHRILSLRERTALPVLLETVSSLPGIHYARLEPHTANAADSPVRILDAGNRTTAEARIVTTRGTLIVGLDAANFSRHRYQLIQQFLLFALLLLALGLFFSWLLYHAQQRSLALTRRFERTLAKEHEAAALGRVTATIAHEIRNPLNAINIGLQRLEIESENLDAEQLALLGAMRSEVTRTSTIVGTLQRFTRPLRPARSQVDLAALLRRHLALYHQAIAEQGIELETRFPERFLAAVDADLIAEVVQNLLKNSIEAQPDGGFLRLHLAERDRGILLSLSNGGFTLDPDAAGRLGEPYFSTKTRGTGLGLALCQRIIEAHQGHLRITPDFRNHTLRLEIWLPTAENLES